jgi:Asp-tRNA(Asn)/Glu-tRNA(Gln) amidotransferase A subunit family amidase
MALGNLTGIPCMTLPVGYDVNGLPISLQVMSGWWQEHVMLRVAHTCEGFVEHKRPEVYYDILEK